MRGRNTFSVRGKRVLVMGLGVHQGGLGVTKWLVRHGAYVTVTDLKTRKQLAASLQELHGLPRIRYVLGRHRIADFTGADMIIQNPAVPHHSPYLRAARKVHIPIDNEASLFFRLTRAPVIGITGTKGKSSTTAFTGQLLAGGSGRVATVGNIRNSFFSVVDGFGPRDRVVAELSSWHIEGMAAQRQSPHIAVLTNVHEDHLNRYASFAAYAKTKSMLFAFQRKNDYAVLNRDNPAARAIGKNVVSRRYWFSLRRFPDENGCFLDKKGIVVRSGGKEHLLVARNLLPTEERDTLQNILAAVLTAYLAGAARAALQRFVPKLKRPEGRREVIRRLAGRVFVNDTTATAPIATIQALAHTTQPIVLIVGGENKKLSYVALAEVIRKRVVRVFLLPGSASNLLMKSFRRKPPRMLQRVRTVEEAVQRAWKVSTPGDMVLFSPGAASFNQFAHEFERGEAFTKTVKALRV